MIAAIFMAGSLAAATIDFAAAKQRADLHEASLSSTQNAGLVKSQGDAAGRAFAACMPSPAPTALPSFTIVLMLDDAGHPRQTWRQGNSEFARCVERQFSDSTFFRPPSAPFFTSFAFTFKP